MHTKLKDYPQGMRDFVKRSCNHPCPTTTELYDRGAREYLKDFTFPTMIPLAIAISCMYRDVGVHPASSRELELIIYDMNCKGCSEHEMLAIATIASTSNKTLTTCGCLFSKLSTIIKQIVQDHGDTVFLKGNVAHIHKNTKPQPNPPPTNYSNN